MQFGVLDCSATLPSGKTTYQRFDVSPKIKPTYIFAGGDKKPQQIRESDSKTAAALTAFVKNLATRKYHNPVSGVLRWLQCRSNTISRPLRPSHRIYPPPPPPFPRLLDGGATRRGKTVDSVLAAVLLCFPVTVHSPAAAISQTTTAQLQNVCTGKKRCAMYVSRGRLSKKLRSNMGKMMITHPKLSVSHIDMSSLDFSMENELDGSPIFLVRAAADSGFPMETPGLPICSICGIAADLNPPPGHRCRGRPAGVLQAARRARQSGQQEGRVCSAHRRL